MCQPGTQMLLNVSSETQGISLQPSLRFPNVLGIRVEVSGQVLSQGGDVGADQIADTSAAKPDRWAVASCLSARCKQGAGHGCASQAAQKIPQLPTPTCGQTCFCPGTCWPAWQSPADINIKNKILPDFIQLYNCNMLFSTLCPVQVHWSVLLQAEHRLPACCCHPGAGAWDAHQHSHRRHS